MVYRQHMQHNMKARFLQGRMMPETAMGGAIPHLLGSLFERQRGRMLLSK